MIWVRAHLESTTMLVLARPFLGMAVAAMAAASIARADDRPMSETILGVENPQLADGASALEAGRAEDGIRLTLEGLKQPTPAPLAAAAHANLCAGYVLLRRLDEALAHCNTAIAMDPNNWRAYNNRAAVFSARSLYDEAITDVRAGLKLAPNSATLHKSLEILFHNQKLERGRSRSRSHA
jgi:tetratricopeptide (TPR) repeat protein